MEGEHHKELPPGTKPAEVFRILAELAKEWGGEWEVQGSQQAQLTLPVCAGLRRGWVRGRLRLESAGETGDEASSLRFSIDESHYFVDRAAIFLLSLSGAGGLLTMAWPLFAHRYPQVLSLVPMAVLLALGGWFLVVSRLQQAGPENFLESVLETLEAPSTSGKG